MNLFEEYFDINKYVEETYYSEFDNLVNDKEGIKMIQIYSEIQNKDIIENYRKRREVRKQYLELLNSLNNFKELHVFRNRNNSQDRLNHLNYLILKLEYFLKRDYCDSYNLKEIMEEINQDWFVGMQTENMEMYLFA